MSTTGRPLRRVAGAGGGGGGGHGGGLRGRQRYNKQIDRQAIFFPLRLGSLIPPPLPTHQKTSPPPPWRGSPMSHPPIHPSPLNQSFNPDYYRPHVHILSHPYQRHRPRHPGVARPPRPHPHPRRHAHDQRHRLRTEAAVSQNIGRHTI